MLLPRMPKAQVGSRVILAPEHAKRLLAALNDNITRYEKEFGKIELPQQGGARTVAPFGTPKGRGLKPRLSVLNFHNVKFLASGPLHRGQGAFL